jgi:S-adenosylmethionine-diacylgycerolhomoserine-N-methlytransferase
MSNLIDPIQSHADIMDQLYAWQVNIYDLTRKYYLLDRDFLLSNLCPPIHGNIIEIGCGTGRNLIKTANLYPETSLVGLDISSVMLEKAHKNICRAGLEHRIQLLHADSVKLDYSHVLLLPKSYDRVFCSYTLSMIPDWTQALFLIAKLVKDNGSLHIVDFGEMNRLPSFIKLCIRQWLKIFHTKPRDNLASELNRLFESGFDYEISHPHYGYSIFIKATKNLKPASST